MGSRLNYSGFVIAGIGFFLTRFTLTLAIYEDPLRFYVAGVAPLALGLGLAAFGVALAVADVDPSVVRTTAAWCILGTVTMLLLAVLTLIGSTGELSLDPTTVRSQSHLSSFLIGGSVGGTLTGLYAARNRRQRTELQRQSDRLVVLNHMLRHKILNALTPLRGYAMTDTTNNPSAKTVIEERTVAIEETIEEVRYFTNRTGDQQSSGVPTDLNASLTEAVETVHDRRPGANISIESVPDDITVLADDRLADVFVHLLENAIVHANDESPRIEVHETRDFVRVSVTDAGSGLPESQRRLLETGEIGEQDRLDMGFGLDLVRLFAECYEASIETNATDSGTTITLCLPRPASEEPGTPSVKSGRTGTLPTVPNVAVTVIASLVAGVFYGLASESLGGSVSGIGVFYGIANPIVGWLTHEFHSVVFGFIYVSLLSVVPAGYRDDIETYLLVGIGWGIALWIGAAGIIAPIWLQLIGVPASLPNLSFPFLLTHLVWGGTLAVCTFLGFTYISPTLRDVGDRLRRAVTETSH